MAKHNFYLTVSLKNALQTGLAVKVNHRKMTQNCTILGEKVKIKLTTVKFIFLFNTGLYWLLEARSKTCPGAVQCQLSHPVFHVQ